MANNYKCKHKYVCLIRTREHELELWFPDFSNEYFHAPKQNTILGLMVTWFAYKKCCDYTDAGKPLPEPTSVVSMDGWDYAMWVDVPTKEDLDECGEKNKERGADVDERPSHEEKLFTMEDLRKDLGIEFE